MKSSNVESSENKLPIDIWMIILSQLKDTNLTPNDPVNFITIMKMSLINNSFKAKITDNAFWKLHNSIDYESANYNIYDCNINFCRIIHNVHTIQAQTMNYSIDVKNEFSFDGNNIYKFVNLHEKQFTKYILQEKAIMPNNLLIGSINFVFNNIKCYGILENSHCILFKALYWNEHPISFVIKKQEQMSITDKLTDLLNQYDNEYDSHKNLSNARSYYRGNDEILHDNYLFYVGNEVKRINSLFYIIISFNAKNITTGTKYLIHEIKERICNKND